MLNWMKALAHRAADSPTLGPALLVAYSRLRPPPWRRPAMEFECNGWTGASTVLSVDGRPIGENNAAPARYRAAVPTAHRACPFADSRRGLQMNVSAARNVLAVWTEVKAFTALLRQDYVQRRGLDPAARLTPGLAYALSRCAAAVPAYLVRRRAAPLPRMPRLETSLFTMGVAPYLLMLVRLEGGDATVADGAPMLDGQRMYELADATGALISPVTGKACAGSPRLIAEYFDVLLDGAPPPPASSEAWQALARLGDLDRFHAYAAAAARLEMLVKLAQGLYAHALLTLAPLALPEEAGLRQQALAQCHYRRETPLDDLALARHATAGALALLDEWAPPQAPSEVRAELQAAGLVDADGRPCSGPAAAADARRWAATRLAGTTLLLQPLAARAQQEAHAALGRFEGHAIEADAFQHRCGGEALGRLLARLHDPAPWAQPAAASFAEPATVRGAGVATGLSHGS
jgi:hypothetical protein